MGRAWLASHAQHWQRVDRSGHIKHYHHPFCHKMVMKNVAVAAATAPLPDDGCQHSCLATFATKPDDAELQNLYTDCDASELEERSYQILLPIVKKLVQLYKEHGDLEKKGDFRIACAVCPNLVQFRGWEALLIHAEMYWKSCHRQHKGYYRALNEAFKTEEFEPFTAHPIPFPPVLLVQNSGLNFDGSLRRWKGLQGEEVPDNIRDIEIEEVLAIYKKGGQDARGVIVFPATEVGIVDANKLNHVLETCPMLDDWIRFRSAAGDSSKKPRGVIESAKVERDLGDGTVGADTKKETEVHDDKRQDQTATESNVDYDGHHPLGNWASLRQIKEVGRVESIMDKWSESLAGAKGYHAFPHRWPFRKSKKLREMDMKFQEDLRKFNQKDSIGNERLRIQLQEIEQQLCKERLLWLKEINEVREQFQDTEDDLRRTE